MELSTIAIGSKEGEGEHCKTCSPLLPRSLFKRESHPLSLIGSLYGNFFCLIAPPMLISRPLGVWGTRVGFSVVGTRMVLASLLPSFKFSPSRVNPTLPFLFPSLPPTDGGCHFRAIKHSGSSAKTVGKVSPGFSHSFYGFLLSFRQKNIIIPDTSPSPFTVCAFMSTVFAPDDEQSHAREGVFWVLSNQYLIHESLLFRFNCYEILGFAALYSIQAVLPATSPPHKERI